MRRTALEHLYTLGFRLHRRWAAASARRLGPLTLAVGALRAGGSGKTPVTLHVARACAARGAHVCVLARGYRRPDDRPLEAFDTKTSDFLYKKITSASKWRALYRSAGDEAAEAALAIALDPIRRGRLSWWVGADRRRAYDLAATTAGTPDLVILDDGVTHHAITHDVPIILHAPADLTAHALPTGPLRLTPGCVSPEALWWSHGATSRRAEVHSRIVLDRALFGKTPRAVSDLGPTLLICGTGAPGRVRESFLEAGGTLGGMWTLEDHHDYTHAHAARLAAMARAFEATVTTRKDHVKLAALWPADAPPLGMLDVSVASTGLDPHIDRWCAEATR